MRYDQNMEKGKINQILWLLCYHVICYWSIFPVQFCFRKLHLLNIIIIISISIYSLLALNLYFYSSETIHFNPWIWFNFMIIMNSHKKLCLDVQKIENQIPFATYNVNFYVFFFRNYFSNSKTFEYFNTFDKTIKKTWMRLR